MRTFIRLLIAAVPFIAFTSNGYAQRGEFEISKMKLNLATNSALPRLSKAYVVITWPKSEFTEYNLYRKSNAIERYPTEPLNGQIPISVLGNCDEIKTWIPQDSADWNRMANLLGTEDAPFDPCAISDIIRDTTPWERLQMLARGNWKIAILAGQGFKDESVSAGTTYYYELRGIDYRTEKEVILVSDAAITAGSPVKLPAPTTVDAIADDSKVLVLWSDVANAAGYLVYRATNAAFTAPLRINDATLPARFTHDLQGVTIPISSGYVDYTVWDEYGNPIPRTVNGISIPSPKNGVKYYYKVSALDMLNHEGTLSSSMATATPVDRTPPMTPNNVSINANGPLNQLEIRWNKVTYDVAGHAEDSIQGYRVYRYDIPDSTASAVAVGGLIPQPAAGYEFVTINDTASVLRPLYGEKTFWYRIRCIDGNGNEGALSAAASGYLKDVTPPAAPKNVKAEGFESFIRIMWDPNTEPDLDGYLIYRSLCEFGQWTCVSEEQKKRQEKNREKVCPETFKLVGYVSKDEAEAFIKSGLPPQFDDGSVPAGSPLCYAYLVKAIDRSQNENGTMPPNITKEIIVCQRLREKTPPEPAIVSSLLARDNANLIEWIGAPVQDIAAYHVYRSEKQEGPYKWIGGMTVERPSSPATYLAAPYTSPSLVGCKEVALVPVETMSTGTLLDKHIEPKTIYWYKVLGIDLGGNESVVDAAVPVSTFTFSTNVPSPPAIQNVAIQSPTCALTVDWTPAFSAASYRGFIVFRSRSATGSFMQISDLVLDNQYVDTHVVRGAEYWYKVLIVDHKGNLSSLSAAKNGKVTP